MKIKFLILILAAAFLVLFLRRPDAILHPQFWAEDGRIWFADAYNFGGFKSLFLSQAGYFHALPRITALISLPFPISKSPLVFNVIALLVQILPVLLIFSGRLNKIIPQFSTRVLLALLYVLLPNTAEVHGNISNAIWFLSLAAFLVLVAEESGRKFWNYFDNIILVLAGLSGPFSIFLSPVAFLLWYRERNKRNLRNLVLIASTAALQLLGIFFLNNGGRARIFPEDLTAKLIFAILGRQVIWGSLIGVNGYSWVLHTIPWYFWFFAITTSLALLPVIYAIIRSPLQLKLFLLFGGLVFAASLLSPTVHSNGYAPLKHLSLSDAGMRYWLIPMCVFLATLVWNLGKTRPRFIKVLSGIFLATIIFGAIVDFKHPRFIDYQFSDQIQKFRRLPVGQQITIRINPRGWDLVLIKK